MGDLDFFNILIFIAGGFTASAITALAGFAFGIIAAGPWLHVLTPSQTTALIVAYGLLVQGYSGVEVARSHQNRPVVSVFTWRRDWQSARRSVAELGKRDAFTPRRGRGADRLRRLWSAASEFAEFCWREPIHRRSCRLFRRRTRRRHRTRRNCGHDLVGAAGMVQG